MRDRHTRDDSVLVDTGSGPPVAVVPGTLLIPDSQAERAASVLVAAGSRAQRRTSMVVRRPGFAEFVLPADEYAARAPTLDETPDETPDRTIAHGMATVRDVVTLRRAGVEAQPDHVLLGHGLVGMPMKGFPMKGFPMKGFPMKGFGEAGVDGLITGWISLTGSTGRPPARPGSTWPTSTDAPGSSLAEPAADPGAPVPHFDDASPLTVLVLDTGVPETSHLPGALSGLAPHAADDPDTPDLNADHLLDVQAGHGAFIAGIIGRLAPGCRIVARRVLSADGVARETEVADILREYAGEVDLVNLSMGTYTPFHPRVLEEAVRAIQTGDEGKGRAGVVVASAGNDGLPLPTFPASLPGVVSVGALDVDGPAAFSNHGPWVRACAPGTDVVSTFFSDFTSGTDEDVRAFDGWARWSGTSFSAPAVVAALALTIQREGVTAPESVERVVDAPGLLRLESMGTVVNIA